MCADILAKYESAKGAEGVDWRGLTNTGGKNVRIVGVRGLVGWQKPFAHLLRSVDQIFLRVAAFVFIV